MILDMAVSLRSRPALAGSGRRCRAAPRQGVVCPAVHPQLAVGGQCLRELLVRFLAVAASDQHAGVVVARVGGPGAGAALFVEPNCRLEESCGLVEATGCGRASDGCLQLIQPPLLSVTLSIGITLRPANPSVPSAPAGRLAAAVCWQT
jgi:hypothetical protein